jgi:ATPase family associated with various cellular activities (AAA).
MPYETGGRADKFGNRYEDKWVILKLLDLIEEKIEGIVLEAIGDDEIGVDIWVNEKDGCRIAYQCKGRNASKEYWDVSSLRASGIIAKSKRQLDRNPKHKFSLVSAVNCSMLIDLTTRARNSNDISEDFLKFQIEGSSKEFKEFFFSYCTALGLDFNKSTELVSIFDYLSRTFFNFFSDTEIEKQKIFDRIKFLFIGDEMIIYNHLQSFIEEDILGKTINNSQVLSYLISKNVEFRDLNNDKRILPRIRTLNKEYKKTFVSISDKLFERSEFNKCIEEIENEKSLIIHGKAGSGKSGCTQAIIEHCESTKKAYIAIKLDKKIPQGSSRKFGDYLGLRGSIVHCLGRISKDNSCVIILDQLDALRWTQSHSRDALEVCSEIIQEVKNLNHDREKKISLVLVCRTYDLENDNNIKLLFESKSEKTSEWINIAVGDFDEKILLEVIGEAYNGFSSKLKKLLHTPVNLYIWDKLEKKSEFNEFTTNTQLIEEWWKQLCINTTNVEMKDTELIAFKNKIVEKMILSNNLSVVKIALKSSYNSLDYLVSNGMLVDNGKNISFVHQSMYDFFIVENMIDRFYSDDESIESLIGTKEKQTPVKRYQLQMLLQNIAEQDIDSFMQIGKEILNSKQIRFYMKYVFFEVLGQIREIDYAVQSFIKEWIYDEKYMTHIIDSVIRGHIQFVELLIDEGIIPLWLESEYSEKALDLLYSVRDQNSCKVRKLLKNTLFRSEDLDKKLIDCFGYDVASEHEELFLLRMEVYKHHPEFFKITSYKYQRVI